MRIMVTGVNGFIGSHICKILLQDHHEIVGIGTQLTCDTQGIQYIHADIVSPEFASKLKTRLNSCDVIIHAAACILMEPFNDRVLDVNCKGTNHILELATKISCQQLIHTSSLPIIGFPTELPIIEEQLPKPKTLYHISKLAAEHIVKQSDRYGIKAVNLRISSPIGAGMNEKTFLPILLRKSLANEPITIYGKGLRRQNYIDVRDIAEFVMGCINNNLTGTYNVAAETVISNIDLAKLCIQITNSTSEIVYSGKNDPEENYRWEVSIAKAKKHFGFNPKYSIADSIIDILDYWKMRNQ